MRFLALTLAAGCTLKDTPSDGVPQEDRPAAFEAPWEDLEATDEATGAFEAELEEALPGPGWFHTGSDDVWGAEGAWVRRTQPQGASDEVFTVSIGGRSGADVLVLQFVVAGAAWQEGEIPVDGEAAIGSIFRVGDEGGPLAYVVSGDLSLEDAGEEAGDEVKGTFTDLVVAEVSL